MKKEIETGKNIIKEKGLKKFMGLVIKNIIKNLKIASNNIVDKCIQPYSRIYSILFNKPLIHVIGDSHTGAFRRSRLFIVHHVGAATAYNLIKKNSSTMSNEKLFNIIKKIKKKKEIVLLIFGEIDCRIQVYYQFKKNNEKIPISELIDKTIFNYGIVLKQLKDRGVNFYVHGIPAASKQGNFYNYEYYAPSEIRVKINKECNEKLKKYCKENGYKYIEVYNKVSDDNGFINDRYAADEVHLNSKIKRFILEVLNIK